MVCLYDEYEIIVLTPNEYNYKYCLILFDLVGAIAATASGSTINYDWPHYIIDLNCTGNERSIWGCSYNGFMDYICHDSHDAIVSCQSNN